MYTLCLPLYLGTERTGIYASATNLLVYTQQLSPGVIAYALECYYRNTEYRGKVR